MAELQAGLTRGRFLGWAQASLASMGVGSMLGGGSAASEDLVKNDAGEDEDYYGKLGVPTIINAAGTYTYLTAAVMPPQVRKACSTVGRRAISVSKY